MKINAIGFVAIPVTDIPRARKFYEEVLGLSVSDEMMGGRWIEYAVDDDTLAIANVEHQVVGVEVLVTEGWGQYACQQVPMCLQGV